MNDAHATDVVALVSCCVAGPRYVRASARATYQCGRCHSSGVTLRLVTLGDRGAIPEFERDAADGSTPPADVNTTDAVTSVGAVHG